MSSPCRARRYFLPFLASLLLVAGAAGVAPAQQPETLFTAARSAVRNGLVDKTRPLGFHDERRLFVELPTQGAILIGFDLGIGKFLNIECVYALRPVYQTDAGETYYQDYGSFADRNDGKRVIKTRVVRMERVRAQAGYAVGGITLRSGLNINGLSLTFMRINGRNLDLLQSYTSPWIGDRTGGGEAYISGNGAPLVGVFGSQDDTHAKSLGLFFMKPSFVAPVVVQAVPALAQGPPPPSPQKGSSSLAPPKPGQAPAPPKAEPPGDPAVNPGQGAAEPAAQAPVEPAKGAGQGQRPVAAAMSWLPLAVFGVVSVPAFLFLLVSFGRKGNAEERKRGKSDTDDRTPRRTRRGSRTTPPPLPRDSDDDLDEAQQPERREAAVKKGDTTAAALETGIQAEKRPSLPSPPAWEQKPPQRDEDNEEVPLPVVLVSRSVAPPQK